MKKHLQEPFARGIKLTPEKAAYNRGINHIRWVGLCRH